MLSRSQWILLFGVTCFSTILAQSSMATDAKPCLPYLSTPPDQSSMAATAKPKTYIVPATPATTQWGVFNTAVKPILTIHSGDTVVFETMAASDNMVVPGGANADQIHKMGVAVANRGPHTLTGPIYVDGAEPGDVLKIHLNKIVPRPYASNDIMPGKGLFPDVFSKPYVKYFYLDVKKMEMPFAPGIVVPLAPFPGIVAVAPSKNGEYNSIPPGPFGGNMDLRVLTEGTTLYLPVFKAGAYLWTGDSHAGQGNGEIDLTAIETAFAEFSVTVDVIKHMPLSWPRVETKTDWVATGYDKNLNKALDIAQNEAVKLIMEMRHVSKTDAEKQLYQQWNCPISEVVDELSGVYFMIPKDPNAPAFALPNADTATDYVTVATNKDAMTAMKTASMAMIKKIAALKNMKPLDVYMLSSFALDCRIAPYHPDEAVTVHCMLPKNLWVQ